MGLLDWRGWNPLDELDRRTGLQRPWTKTRVIRTQRLGWVLTALVFLSALINVVERDWAWAVALVVIGVLNLFAYRRAIRKLRERVGL